MISGSQISEFAALSHLTVMNIFGIFHDVDLDFYTFSGFYVLYTKKVNQLIEKLVGTLTNNENSL